MALAWALGVGLAAAGVGVGVGVAHADPLFEPPPIGKKGVILGAAEADAADMGVTIDVRLLGVVSVSRLASWPDRRLGLEEGQPALAVGQVGLMTHFRGAPISLVVRADAAELDRPSGPDEPSVVPKIDAIVDDFYLLWRPARAAQVVLGRARVPIFAGRLVEDRDQPLGSAGFLTDRIAPDRRWGATFVGDLGAMAYGAGAWEDVDSLEAREGRTLAEDPSAGGRFAAGGWVDWTPVAPMSGSNPPGRVPGARGPLPTPRSDPWFDTGRFSLGVGALWRRRADGSTRVDSSLALRWKWRWFGGVAETICTDQCAAAGHSPGGHVDLMVTPFDDRFALTGRAEWDPGAGVRGEWSAGGGVTWHVTKDRLNKVSLVAWARRDRDRAPPLDGFLVLLQAAI